MTININSPLRMGYLDRTNILYFQLLFHFSVMSFLKRVSNVSRIYKNPLFELIVLNLNLFKLVNVQSLIAGVFNDTLMDGLVIKSVLKICEILLRPIDV